MTVADVAKGLVTLCRKGKNMQAIEKFYSPDIVSVESASAPGMPREMTGIEAIRGKNQWWLNAHDIHSAEANGPYLGKSQFAVEFKYDVTNKETGKRHQMQEMALYDVKKGKIVREHFFYNMG
ncbi:MAG: nuclear transport factor 2 family protein [Bryobacteraceae bacterium]